MVIPGVPVKVGNRSTDCVVYFDFSRARQQHGDVEFFDDYSVNWTDSRPWASDCPSGDEYGWEAEWDRK